MLKLVFYVPESHLAQVKAAVFKAGAGQSEQYDQCAWQVLGQGQFRPLPGSDPYIGEHNKLAQVSEYRVETICPDDKIDAVIEALIAAHPYEQPAFEAWRLDHSSFIIRSGV
jgi:hypothetical protein